MSLVICERIENMSDRKNRLVFCSRRVYLKNLSSNNLIYYIAVSHKDWELPNSRIWLAEIYIDRGLDFPI